MKLRYVSGDILLAPQTIVVQGCNAQGAMNSGLARTIRDLHPEVFSEYRAAYEDARSRGLPSLPLGDIVYVPVSSTRTFANAITQEYYGRDKSVVYASYPAISKAVDNLNALAIASQADGGDAIQEIAFPLIGAGLANGDWKIISELIEEGSEAFQAVVYLLDDKLP